MIIVSAVVIVLGIALGVVAGLAWFRRLPGNSYIGVRTPETRARRETWEIANRAAAPAMGGGALVTVLGALISTQMSLVSGGFLLILAAAAGLLLAGIGGSLGTRTAALYDAVRPAPEPVADGCCSAGNTGAAAPLGAAGGQTAQAVAGTTAAGHPAGTSPAEACGVPHGCASCSLKGLCTAEDSAAVAPSHG